MRVSCPQAGQNFGVASAKAWRQLGQAASAGVAGVAGVAGATEDIGCHGNRRRSANRQCRDAFAPRVRCPARCPARRQFSRGAAFLVQFRLHQLWQLTAAAVGVIVNLALFFSHHVLCPQGFDGAFDVVSAVMAVAAALALMHFKLGVVTVLSGCALPGLVWKLLS